MKKADIAVGGAYTMMVSGNKVIVEITREHPYGGWEGVNRKTGRAVRVRSAQRCRAETYGSIARRLRQGEEVPVSASDVCFEVLERLGIARDDLEVMPAPKKYSKNWLARLKTGREEISAYELAGSIFPKTAPGMRETAD